MPTYAKAVLTLFCTCIIFFGIQVSSYMIQNQKNISYQLSELKQNGIEYRKRRSNYQPVWSYS